MSTVHGMIGAARAGSRARRRDWERAAVSRLGAFATSADDPVFRRRLNSDARSALAAHFAFSDRDPTRVHLRRSEPELVINEAVLFGVTALDEIGDVALPPELRRMAYGVKRAALIHGHQSELELLREAAARRGWFALLSPLAFVTGADPGKGGYSNIITSFKRPLGTPSDGRALVVAVDFDDALALWAGLAFQADALIAARLGYPDCCADAYARRWPEASARRSGDVAALLLEEHGAGPHDWRTNVLGRYFGAALIEHFPCRPDCAASLCDADRVFQALTRFEPETASAIRRVLASPALYTNADGVAVLTDSNVEATADGWRVEFPSALALRTSQGRLAEALASRPSSVARFPASGDGFVLNDIDFEGRAAVFADAPPNQSPSANGQV